MNISIFIIIILLFLSAFFSGSETALYSFDKIERRRILQKDEPRFRYIKRLLSMHNQLLVTILLGNLIVNILLSNLSDKLFSEIKSLPDFAIILIAIFFSLVILIIFGEIFPKSLAVHTRMKFSLAAARPLYAFSLMIFPLRWFFNKMTEWVIKLFPVNLNMELSLSNEELKTILDVAKAEKSISPDEKYLIENVLEFQTLEARHIMTPRPKLIALEISSSLDKVLYQVKQSSFSIYPVYKESLDNIVGIIYRNELLPYYHKLRDDFDLKLLMIEAYTVTESRPLREVLQSFRIKKIGCAIVVDEYGGTAGLITLNDILRKILGEFTEEKEEHQRGIFRVGNNKFIVKGETPLDEFSRFINREVSDPENETIAGFLLSNFDRIPKKNEVLEINNIRYMIKGVDETKILYVYVILTDETEQEKT